MTFGYCDNHFRTQCPDQLYLGELVAHDGVLLGEVHDAEGELESRVGLEENINEYS